MIPLESFFKYIDDDRTSFILNPSTYSQTKISQHQEHALWKSQNCFQAEFGNYHRLRFDQILRNSVSAHDVKDDSNPWVLLYRNIQ